ncbi:MAG: hypothetical protein MUF64_14595 [Polyangiaceae bacterium]|nr:hypothetical protein [Polyangiaceae bacterium]
MVAAKKSGSRKVEHGVSLPCSTGDVISFHTLTTQGKSAGSCCSMASTSSRLGAS